MHRNKQMLKERCKTEKRIRNTYKMGKKISVRMETKRLKEEREKDEIIR
jgi:hypothetical protein